MSTARKNGTPTGALFTIGYEGRTIDELIRRLRDSGVQVLVDVRQNAISRKAGFGKRQLSESLEVAGIEYLHEPRLGNPRHNREAFRNGSVATGRRRYLKDLNNGSRPAFDELVTLALTQRVALLCFEREQAQCHRSCIVEQAQAEHGGLSVTQL